MLAINVYISDIFTRHTKVFYFAILFLGLSTFVDFKLKSNLPILYFLSRHHFLYMTLHCEYSGESSLIVAKYEYFLVLSECLSAGAGPSLRRNLQNDF